MLPDEIIERCEPLTIDRRGSSWETRPSSELEFRLDGDDAAPEIRGYALVYDFEYRVGGDNGFTEVIRPGAAKKTVNEGDIRLLVNHDGIPLARSRAGKGTLTVGSDDTGVSVRAVLDGNSPTVRSVVSAMERGDLDEMSHAFQVVGNRQRYDRGTQLRSIDEIRMFDVSIVSQPMNPATVVGLHRSADEEELEARTGLVTVDFVRAFLASH